MVQSGANEKDRPAQQVAEIGYVIGDVAGKTAVLVDDMIGTAGTLKAAAQTVIDEGATRVYAAATHAVFSEVTAENLASANFEQVVVTDTIPLSPEAEASPRIRQLSCAQLLAETMTRVSNEESVSSLFTE